MPERTDEETQDHLRQLSAGSRRLPKDASPIMIRAAQGWGLRLDPVPLPGFVARRPEVFVVNDDGLVGVRVRCRSCSKRSVLWPVDEGEPVPGGLSATAVWIVQRWCCEECGAIEEAAHERASSAKVVRDRLAASDLPPALAAEVSWPTMLEKGGTDAETKQRTRAIETARLWSEKPEPPHALLLWGPPGSGKTRLAATAATARMRHSDIKWVSVAVLMAQLDAAWSDGDRHAALAVLTGKGAIVMDDLDKIGEKPSQRVLGHLFTAIDKREQRKQNAVIFTVNLEPKLLAVRLGDVLMSRLVGMCTLGGVLPFPGPDRRLKMGDE